MIQIQDIEKEPILCFDDPEISDNSKKKIVCYTPKPFLYKTNGFYIRNNEPKTYVEIVENKHKLYNPNIKKYNAEKDNSEKDDSLYDLININEQKGNSIKVDTKPYEEIWLNMLNREEQCIDIPINANPTGSVKTHLNENEKMLVLAGLYEKQDFTEEKHNFLNIFNKFIVNSYKKMSKLILGNFRKGK